MSPTPPIETPEAKKRQDFAKETREHYDALPEKPQSITEKVTGFVKEGGKTLMREFENGNVVKKIAILGGLAAAGYLAYKGIKKLGEMIGNGFKRLFGIGEKLQSDLESAKDGTVMSILKMALGGTLAVGTISALYEAINGKISLAEITEAWAKDGVKGVGMLLLRKQKEGVISIGKDLWGGISGTLGLPSLDTVKEKLGDVKEEVDKAYDWLDEKCNFGALKIRMENFFTKHNIQMPDWIKNLNLSEMAKDMGIDTDKENLKTYAAYLGTAGAALLVYRWTKSKGLKKGIILNACVYLAIINETTGEPLREIISAIGTELDEAKKKLFTKWSGDSQIVAYLEDMFGEFSIEKHLESSLEWIKEHPGESMLAMNGMWLLRGIIVKGLKMSAKVGWETLKLAASNPLKAGAIGVGAALLYAGRAEFITDFIKLAYDDLKSEAATDMQKNLDKIFNVDRDKAPGVVEKQSHDLLNSILEDPMKALNLKETQEAFEKGVFALGFDIGGKVILLMKSLDLPIQLAGITKAAFASLPVIYSPDYEGNRLAATTIVGAEILLLGSTTYIVGKEGIKATKAIFEINDKGAKAVGKVLWSLMPFSQEWKFVFRSMISAPFVPMMQSFQGAHIGKVEADMQKIMAEIAADKPDMMKKIQKMAADLGEHHMFKDYEKIKTALTGTRFGYEFAKQFADVRRTVRSIEEAAKKQNPDELANIRNFVKDIQEKTTLYKSGVSHFVERWELIKQGKVSDALSRITPSEKAENAAREAAETPFRPLSAQETFRKTNGAYKTEVELRTEKSALEAEMTALDAKDPLKKVKQKKIMAIEAFLDPSKFDHMGAATESEIRALDNTAKATHLEDMAFRLEAAEKGIQEKFTQSVDTIVQDAKARNIPLSDPSVTRQLDELQTKLIDPLAKQKAEALKIITEEYKSLPKELRTPLMKAQIKNVLEGTEGRLAVRLMKGAKGRMKLMAVMAGLMFATDALMQKDDPEHELIGMLQELGPDLGQLLVDVLPGVGTASNFWSAIAGKEYVSGKDVSSAGDRASNVAWGVVGLAGDALTVLGSVPSGGTSVAANVFLRVSKAAKGGSKTAIKMIEMWPRFEKLANKMGGFEKLINKILKFTHENKGMIAKGLRATEKVSMAAGTALLAGGVGYHLYFKDVPAAEIEVPTDLSGESAEAAATPHS